MRVKGYSRKREEKKKEKETKSNICPPFILVNAMGWSKLELAWTVYEKAKKKQQKKPQL